MFADMTDGYSDALLQTNQLISPGLSGLRNLGTTCYVNAVIQALSNCPQLTEYFLECNTILDPHHKHVLFTNYCALISEIWRNQRPRCFSTNSILDAFCVIHPIFRSFSQHDAQEFLRLFLVQLHDELKISNQRVFDNIDLKHANSMPMESASIITDVFQGQLVSTVRCLSCNGLSNREESFMDLSLSLARPSTQTSAVSLSSKQDNRPRQTSAMNGYLKSSSSYISHQSHTDTSNHLLVEQLPKSSSSFVNELRRWTPLDLSVVGRLVGGIPWLITLIFTFFNIALAYLGKYIPSPTRWIDTWSTLTVDECLAHYFSEAELVGENKYFCGICNRCCNGSKQFTLLALPEILTLHLKRFNSNHVYSSKITSPVHFPLKNLDLRSFLHIDCKDKITTYDLIGVICHYGGCGGGHYITYALNASTESWYEFDDEQVRKLDSEHVESLKSSAYILFYRKQDSSIDPLRQSWQHTPGSPICYISKSWFVRFWTWAEPGPITSEYLCTHGFFRPELWSLRNDLTLPIPEVIYSKLHQSFGGHSAIRDLVPCAHCCDAICERQKHEFTEFVRIGSAKKDSSIIYAISKRWLDTWLCFVRARTWEPPGPIDNTDIFIGNPPSVHLHRNNNVPFKYSQAAAESQLDDYETLSADIWTMLFSIYGGGPIVPIYCASTNNSVPAIDSNKASKNNTEESLSDQSLSKKSSSNSPNLRAHVSHASTYPPVNVSDDLNWTESADSFIPISQNVLENGDGVSYADEHYSEVYYNDVPADSPESCLLKDNFLPKTEPNQSTITCHGDTNLNHSVLESELVVNCTPTDDSSHLLHMNGSMNEVDDKCMLSNMLHSAGDINTSDSTLHLVNDKVIRNKSVKRSLHKRPTKQAPAHKKISDYCDQDLGNNEINEIKQTSVQQ